MTARPTRALIVLILVVLCPGWLWAAEAEAEKEAPKPVADATLVGAMEGAAKDGALVLVVFVSDFSESCAALKEDTLSSAELQQDGGALHVVSIDVDLEEPVARRFRVGPVPDLVLVTAEEKIIARAQRFMTAAELVRWVDDGRKRAAAGVWDGIAAEVVADEVPRGADPETVARAAEMLGARDAADRARVIAALAARRGEAMPVVLAGLAHDYLGVRIGAAELLRKLAPQGPAFDPWAAKATRAASLDEIKQWWAGAGTLPAVNADDEAGPQERRAIDAAIDDVLADDPVRRTEGMSALVCIGHEALPAVREAIAHAATLDDPRAVRLLDDVRWAVLVPYSLEAQAHVRRDLARGTSEQRQAAAMRLAVAGKSQERSASPSSRVTSTQPKRSEALPALRELIDDADPLVKECAVQSLLSIGGKGALEAIAVLLKAEDTNLRMVAAQALGQSKSSSAGRYLAEAVADPDEVVACCAIAGLEESGARDQADKLIECLGDTRWRVRAAAAKALGELEIRKAAKPLAELLDDGDAFVVQSTLVALGEIGAKPDRQKLVALAERLPELTGLVVGQVMQGDSKASFKLIEGLYDGGDEGRRAAVLEALAERSGPGKDDRWRPFLTKVVREPQPRLRALAVRVLNGRSDALKREFISTLLADGAADVRGAAAGLVLDVVASDLGFTTRYEFLPFSVRRGKAQKRVNLSRLITMRTIERRAQYDAWHQILGAHFDGTGAPAGSGVPVDNAASAVAAASAETDIRVPLAFYVTGDCRADLHALEWLVDVKDLERQAAGLRGRGVAGIVLQRLPMPEGQRVLNAWMTKPALCALLLGDIGSARDEVRTFLLDGDRLVAALDAAMARGDGTQSFAAIAYELVSRSRYSRASIQGPDETARRLRTRLLAAEQPATRALGVFAMVSRAEQDDRPALVSALGDKDKWVRYWAVIGLAAITPDQIEREEVLAPMLGDADLLVASAAARGILSSDLRARMGVGFTLNTFIYDELRVYSRGGQSYGPLPTGRGVRPIESFDRRPAFLDEAATRMERLIADKETAAAQVFALLLAQYDDTRGMDMILEEWRRSGTIEAPQVLLMGLQLTGDPKFLAPLRARIEAADEQGELLSLLTWLRGIQGDEARELRREINRRLRRGGRAGTGFEEF